MALFKTAENVIFVFFVPIAVCTIYSCYVNKICISKYWLHIVHLPPLWSSLLSPLLHIFSIHIPLFPLNLKHLPSRPVRLRIFLEPGTRFP